VSDRERSRETMRAARPRRLCAVHDRDFAAPEARWFRQIVRYLTSTDRNPSVSSGSQEPSEAQRVLTLRSVSSWEAVAERTLAAYQ
jgi:hypothetical protein